MIQTNRRERYAMSSAAVSPKSINDNTKDGSAENDSEMITEYDAQQAREDDAAKYMRIDPNDPTTVKLISPVTGKILTIKNVRARLSTSAEALDALKEVEQQVIGMTVLPDFGYAEDNYIIPKTEQCTNKWQILTSLLSNNDKYTWLLS